MILVGTPSPPHPQWESYHPLQHLLSLYPHPLPHLHHHLPPVILNGEYNTYPLIQGVQMGSLQTLGFTLKKVDKISS